MKFKNKIIGLGITSIMLVSGHAIANNANPEPISNEDYSQTKRDLVKQNELAEKQIEFLQNRSSILEAQAKLNGIEERIRKQKEAALKAASKEDSDGPESEPTKVSEFDQAVVKELKLLKEEIALLKSPKEQASDRKIIKKEKTPKESALYDLSDLYLTSIYSSGDSKNVVIMYRGGTTKASKGSSLPGGWQVKEVHTSYISVTHSDVKGPKQISFKSPETIASEMALKQEMRFSRIRNELEVEKMQMQNAILPTVSSAPPMQ